MPASSEITVEPLAPTAATRVAEAKAAAYTGSVEAETAVPGVSPASVVRTSCAPEALPSTHSCGVPQRIEV